MNPSFLILGAAKSGTTSLYHYLSEHPNIYMSPIKEPKYFALGGQQLRYGRQGDAEKMRKSSVLDRASYFSLFEGAKDCQASGEASTIYLYSERAVERIKRELPEARLIAILRNPVERAYSNFLYMVRKGEETLRDFEAALQEERNRRDWMPSWHYVERGFYHRQLARYFDRFPQEQIRVYLYEDLARSPENLLKDIYGFIGVDRFLTPGELKKHNVSGLPRSETLHALQHRPNVVRSVARNLLPTEWKQKLSSHLRSRNLRRPELEPHTRKQLVDIFRDDVLKLQDLIQRDLSAWLEVERS